MNTFSRFLNGKYENDSFNNFLFCFLWVHQNYLNRFRPSLIIYDFMKFFLFDLLYDQTCTFPFLFHILLHRSTDPILFDLSIYLQHFP